jgi:hypothetical protein
MKKEPEREFFPVGNFERQTSYCPTVVAWTVLDEARDYLRKPIPESYADKLAERAERVLAGNPVWRRKYKSRRGRDCLLMTMRHWLAGILNNEQPALFSELPDSYKMGHPLPQRQFAQAETNENKPVAAQAFVHGCEHLPI